VGEQRVVRGDHAAQVVALRLQPGHDLVLLRLLGAVDEGEEGVGGGGDRVALVVRPGLPVLARVLRRPADLHLGDFPVGPVDAVVVFDLRLVQHLHCHVLESYY